MLRAVAASVSAGRALAILVLVCAAALPAGGQRPGAAQEITVAELALGWSHGRFASPVICQLDGRPVRGLRRIVISPGPAHVRPLVNRIVFVDMEVEEATRCIAELQGDVPNVTGQVQFRLHSTRRSDTAQRDFREQLRRKQGFEFDIVSGGLKIQPVTRPETPALGVDFRGGKLSLHEIQKGTDASRLLAPFPSPRKLLLELSARDGTKLSFPLYMTDPR